MTTPILPKILQRLRDEPTESEDLLAAYFAARARLLAVCDELEWLTNKISSAGFDQAGTSEVSRAQVYKSDLERITTKLAAALKL